MDLWGCQKGLLWGQIPLINPKIYLKKVKVRKSPLLNMKISLKPKPPLHLQNKLNQVHRNRPPLGNLTASILTIRFQIKLNLSNKPHPQLLLLFKSRSQVTPTPLSNLRTRVRNNPNSKIGWSVVSLNPKKVTLKGLFHNQSQWSKVRNSQNNRESLLSTKVIRCRKRIWKL